MKISLSGLIPEKDKRELLKAAKFAAKELKISKSKETVFITVSLYGSTDGTCERLGPNKLQIWLNKTLNSEKRLLFLFHEFCHLEQFVSNKLIIAGGRGFYKGIEYTSVKYCEREHEKEAYRKQEVLFSKFKKDSGAASRGNPIGSRGNSRRTTGS